MCASAYDLEGNPTYCGDPMATTCLDASGNVVPCPGVGVAGATMSANPAVPGSQTGSSSTAADLAAMGNTMGQWGATIAGIVTHTPTVVSATGARTGVAAVSPTQSLLSGNTGMLLLVVAAVVVVFLVMKKD
jgi:hypothetical protein